MKQYDISSSYYIIIKDHEIIDSKLIEGINLESNSEQIDVIFSNKDKIEIHIVYDISDYLSVNYKIERHSEVDCIETRILHDESVLNHHIELLDDAHFNLFVENNSNLEGKIKVNDEVSLLNDSKCVIGYGELSEGSVDATYHCDLNGEGADASIRMAVLSHNKDEKNYVVEIDHNAPHTIGNMNNYGVVQDAGTLIIDGIGRIGNGQHASESHQNNKIIVFDEECKAKANPYLFIDEYDVKASHAAAVGKMDEEHLFYLQSRGLSKKESMKLITYGYLRPVCEMINNQVIKDRFEKMLEKVGDQNV